MEAKDAQLQQKDAQLQQKDAQRQQKDAQLQHKDDQIQRQATELRERTLRQQRELQTLRVREWIPEIRGLQQQMQQLEVRVTFGGYLLV